MNERTRPASFLEQDLRYWRGRVDRDLRRLAAETDGRAKALHGYLARQLLKARGRLRRLVRAYEVAAAANENEKARLEDEIQKIGLVISKAESELSRQENLLDALVSQLGAERYRYVLRGALGEIEEGDGEHIPEGLALALAADSWADLAFRLIVERDNLQLVVDGATYIWGAAAKKKLAPVRRALEEADDVIRAHLGDLSAAGKLLQVLMDRFPPLPDEVRAGYFWWSSLQLVGDSANQVLDSIPARHFGIDGEWVRQAMSLIRTEQLPELGEHPSSEELVQHAEGALDSSQKRALRSHLLWCDACSAAYFSVADALVAERFWTGLRKAAGALDAYPEASEEIASKDTTENPAVVGAVSDGRSVVWIVTEGPALVDGDFRMRLELEDTRESVDSTATVLLWLGGENEIEWEQAVEKGVLRWVRNVGPVPEDLSSMTPRQFTYIILRGLRIKLAARAPASPVSPHWVDAMRETSEEEKKAAILEVSQEREGGARREWRTLFGFSKLADAVGADLGATNTLVYVGDAGIIVKEPSIVAVQQDSGVVRGVGGEASEILLADAPEVAAVWPLKEDADPSMVEVLLRHILGAVLPERSVRDRVRMVVAVPATVTEWERRAIRSAAHAAGIKETYMVGKPMAAAIGAGKAVDAGTGRMVVEMGGAATEIAVIQGSSVVRERMIRLGGDDLDRAIRDFLSRERDLRIDQRMAEAVKIRLATACPAKDDREMLVEGSDFDGTSKSVRLNSGEIRECIRDRLRELASTVRAMLEDTPREFVSDISERGISLTGGGALLRGLDRFLYQETGFPVRLDKEAMTSTVRGTGHAARHVDRYRSMLST